MTELSLYKWLNEYKPEWRWKRNDKEELDVIVWIHSWEIDSFLKLFTPNSFPDSGCYPAFIRHDCICLFMSDICQRHGVELKAVFPDRDEEPDF